MKKAIVILVSGILGALILVQLVISSSPFQRKILKKISDSLASEGFEISIESVDVAFFAPRIYLNRVVIKTNEKAQIELENPLEIDKIKVELQILGLLGREIVLEEVALLHPKIIIPRADKLYQRVVEQLEKKKPIEVKGTGWPIVVRRVGIVDSQFDVRSEKPRFSILSRSLTLFFSQTSVGQQSVEVKSNHLELYRGNLDLSLTQLEGDVDFTEESLRLNSLLVAGDGVKLQWKGASSLPSGKRSFSPSFHLSHETDIELALLNKIEELSLPLLSGRLKSSGTIHVSKENYSGEGKLETDKLSVDKKQFGNWSFGYFLGDKEVELRNLEGAIGGGKIEAKRVKAELNGKMPFSGEVTLKQVELNQVFRDLGAEGIPVHLKTEGTVNVTGELKDKWKVNLRNQLAFSGLYILNKVNLGKGRNNQIIHIPDGKLQGTVNLSSQGIEVSNEASLLGGKLGLNGSIADHGGLIRFAGKSLSFDKLKHIADINFGGVTEIEGEIQIVEKDVNVEGKFAIEKASIADLELGSVGGKVQYRGNLLSFSRLEIRAIDVIRGQGYVDFEPQVTDYRFDVNVPRINMSQLLSIFKRNPLPVQEPKGGEVAARVVIEGGKNGKDIEVAIDGQARSFEWYGERWMSASFGMKYHPDSFQVNRGVFLKRSGSLEVKAKYDRDTEQLTLFSSGLRLEDLNHLGTSPIQGEVTGRLVFEGDMNYPRGNGELIVSKLQYRDKKVSDAKILMRSDKNKSEYWLSFEKEALKGHLTRTESEKRTLSELEVTCDQTDFAPYVSAWMGKDISPLNSILVTGNWKMRGEFGLPESIKGIAEIQKLKLGFEGRPLESEEKIDVKISQGGIDIPKIKLQGSGNEISGEIQLIPDRSIEGSLSGKLALDFLQPFIPGLDYASGLVNLNVEASGNPKNFELFGNMSLSDSVFRIAGMRDEFRGVNAQMSLSEEKITFERFQGTLGGGDVVVGGDLGISRFTQFAPHLNLYMSKATIQPQEQLKLQLTGELSLKGSKLPYQLSGNLQIDEGTLSSLQPGGKEKNTQEEPGLMFDIKANANNQLFIKTEVMDAEFKGEFRLVGDTNQIGLLGKTDVIRGKLFFKDTPFELVSGNARFERETEIYPRFSVNGRSVVREQKGRAYQDYEVNLQVLGTPDDYKIRLTSNPPLVEQDLISLLVLGVTTRGQEGNYFDLGTAIMGQSPIKSKIQSELGVDIKVQSTPGQGPGAGGNVSTAPGAASSGPGMVPAVRIEKGITRRTKISYSNTLDQNQARELRLEQMLDDNITLNATAGDRSRNNTQARPGDSFGLDVRYRFEFE